MRTLAQKSKREEKKAANSYADEKKMESKRRRRADRQAGRQQLGNKRAEMHSLLLARISNSAGVTRALN